MACIFSEIGCSEMKKRIVSIIPVLCLLLFTSVHALGAMSLSNFSEMREYRDDFSDVSRDAWYFDGVSTVFERGIMDGKGGGMFDPSGMITIAEIVKIAATLHKGYYTGSMDFPAGTPWYAPYVDYALQNSIPAGAYRIPGAVATRADFAVIISSALPDEAITPINRVADGAIPDVLEVYSYGQAVYRLYRAGVLGGFDSAGTFFPGRTISRAEAAVIVSRIVDAGLRIPLSLAAELTAEEVYRRSSPAVFFIEVLDSDDKVIKTGSGFFICESGLAITNYHVVIGAHAVRITTDSGEVYQVAGMYDYDWKKDMALIQVVGSEFPYLELADSSQLRTGATVYTLGSPLGLQASFTRGIVSQALRVVEDTVYIQLDAPISSGSSGGALLDTSGRVVGVTSATMTASQNINLAVPINLFDDLRRDEYITFRSSLIVAEYYEAFFPAPDFGAFFGMSVFHTDRSRGGVYFSYLLSDFPDEPDDIIDEYTHLIEQNLFERTGYLTSEGNRARMFYNPHHDVMLTIGLQEVNGRECFTVYVS